MKQQHIAIGAISLGLVITGVLLVDRVDKPVAGKPAAGLPPVTTQRPAIRSARFLATRETQALDKNTPQLLTAIARVQAELDPLQREELLQTLVDNITSADLPATVQILQEQDPTNAGRDLQLRLLRRWSSNDPAQAAPWIAQMPAGDTRQEAINSVVTEWAHRDLAKAAQWARELTTENDRHSALLMAAYEAIRNVPQDALALARELPANGARDELITHACSEWALTSPDAAAAWAKQITNDGLRQRTLAAIATSWSNHDPLSAASLAVQSITPNRTQDDALIGIVQRWVQQEPEATLAWVSQFPEGPLRDTALENVHKRRPQEGSAVP
ncbi:MAG: hypothetical protein K0Q55_4211 [Verrucomicrobia bacterium]|nr:hypothetical protein [Verrucomicrobiota bacterium]